MGAAEESADFLRPNGGSHVVHKMPSSSTIGLEDEEDLTFDSPEDEIAYYREKYRQAVDGLIETRAELDEFQTSSKELEDELERELAATEKRETELKDKIKRLEAEKEDWKTKHIALQKQHSSSTAAMQREMDNLRSERDKTLVALRDLEMGNDELERNERVAVSSLLDLESKYNRAIEEKTLLEHEVVLRQELEEEIQRVKDELRDANNEISILRDQVTRAVPTPPSSIGLSMSPVQEASRELSLMDPPPLPDKDLAEERPRQVQAAPTPTRIPRSNTATSIPTLASPAPKRFSTHLVHSPTMSSLSRSVNARNLASAAASPAISRSRSGLPISSPGPSRAPVSSNAAAKSKGFKLLHDLQARLKATDDKLGSKVPKGRNVSAPMPLLAAERAVSGASAVTMPTQPTKASHSRIMAIQEQDTTHTTPMGQDKSSFLSPNGWVMIDDEDTPTNNIAANTAFMQEPRSPLELNFRAVSAASNASNRSLPSRPGIPSPLTAGNNLGRSVSRAQPPPSNSLARSMRHAERPMSPPSSSSSRPMSPQYSSTSRPLSPSMLPQPSRSAFRAPSPALMRSMTPSTSTSLSRPSSRLDKRAQSSLGRGPPPPSSMHPEPRALGLSVSTSASAGLRRSTRRSSVGVGELLPASGIPAPKPSPGRPVSVPVFNSTPPPVPRIPSVHLRSSAVKRTTILGLPADPGDRRRG